MQAEVTINLDGIRKVEDVVKRGLARQDLHNTREAVKAGAELIQATWMQYISGATVAYSKGDFTINSVSGTYRSAVMNGLKYPMAGDILRGGVNIKLDYAERLEKGFDPYDMKTGMLNSPKVKMTVKRDENDASEPYIDVPFRHEEKAIPRAIKTEVKQAGRSLGVVRLAKGLPKTTPYGLRTKLSPQLLRMSPYTWKSGTFAGLTRTPVQGGGGVYMTFRRISGKSTPGSWIHPGVSPKPVTAAIKENIGPALRTMVKNAFKQDVAIFARKAGLAE